MKSFLGFLFFLCIALPMAAEKSLSTLYILNLVASPTPSP